MKQQIKSATTRTKDLKTVTIQNLWHTSGEWHFLFGTACKFIKLYYYRLIRLNVWIRFYRKWNFAGGIYSDVHASNRKCSVGSKLNQDHNSDRKSAYNLEAEVLSVSVIFKM